MNESRCPRCEHGHLRTWADLNEEEREVAKRLPVAADCALEERQARHRWCTKCWYEDTGDTPVAA